MLKILEKLHLIQCEIDHMMKDGTNTFQNYKYLSETQVTLKIKELLDKHNVVFDYSSKITAKTEISPTKSGTKQFVVDVEVFYKFYDVESGEHIDGFAAGQGSDVADKGVYKAITGAIKYIYMKRFNIPTGDDPEKDETTRSNSRSSVSSFETRKQNAVCQKHNVPMIKTAKMKFPAHKDEIRGWCNGAGYKDEKHVTSVVVPTGETAEEAEVPSARDINDDIPF